MGLFSRQAKTTPASTVPATRLPCSPFSVRTGRCKSCSGANLELKEMPRGWRGYSGGGTCLVCDDCGAEQV